MLAAGIFFVGLADALTATAPLVVTRKQDLLRVLQDEVPAGRTTASPFAQQKIRSCAEALEDRSIVLPRDMAKLQGTWKLLYTTNAPPLPSLGAAPKTTAFQKIDSTTVTNTVLVDAPDFLKDVPFLSGGRIDLEHSLTFDEARPQRIRIALRKISRQGFGDSQLPDVVKNLPFFDTLSIPEIPSFLPSDLDAGSFDTTYCDDSLRISRGPLWELRVFEKCYDPPPSPPLFDDDVVVEEKDDNDLPATD